MTLASRQRWVDGLSLASFVALGLPDGMLGTAWPEVRHTFGVPVGYLGLLLLVFTAGSVAVTTFVGYLIRRLGVSVLLAVGLAAAAIAGTAFAAAPVFGVMLGFALVFGMAAGLMDGGLNTAVGLSGRRRLLNLLHGAYGVGTAIGPLVVTVALLAGSWRPAYVVLLVFDALLAGLWLSHRRGLRARPAGVGPPVGESTEASTAHRYRGAIVAGIVMFFVYTGLEAGAGQWETTFARTHLQLSAPQAGLATFGYWGALTAVRFVLALVPRPPPHQAVVRAGCLVAVVGAGLIWWDPVPAVAVAGFVIMGAALAGVFPALVALTPLRLGEHRASDVIAWQVGAAAAGGAALSGLIGLLIGLAGVAVLGPSLLALAGLLVAVELILTRLAPIGA
jgi:fucose permease